MNVPALPLDRPAKVLRVERVLPAPLALSIVTSCSICHTADKPSPRSSEPFRPRRDWLLDTCLVPTAPLSVRSKDTWATPYTVTLLVSAKAGAETMVAASAEATARVIRFFFMLFFSFEIYNKKTKN